MITDHWGLLIAENFNLRRVRMCLEKGEESSREILGLIPKYIKITIFMHGCPEAVFLVVCDPSMNEL